MLTYADGVHVNLELGGDDSVVGSAVAFGKVPVPAADRDVLVPLLFGLDDSYRDDERVAPLIRRKMVVDKSTADDPELEARLDAMGQQWRWQRPSGAGGKRFDKLYRATLRAHARRKIFVQDFGQTPCMPETAVRRALLLGPGHLKVLCIGDDDLLSVPLAMLGHEVTVYDVDDLVLIPFLDEIAEEWSLAIRTERRDLMAPQPRGRRRFDVLFSDPMSTRECFDLFLSRGMAWLKVGGRAFCCVHHLAQEVFHEVQRDMDFAIVARHHDFNHYYEEGFWENYYRSDMVELRKLRSTRPTYPLEREARLDILSGELSTHYHHCVDIRAIDPKHFDRDHIERAIARIKDSGHLPVAAEQRHDGGSTFTYVAAIAGGGYLGLSAYFDEQLLAYDIFPYQQTRDIAIRNAVRREVPQTLTRFTFRAARASKPTEGPDRDD